MPSARIKLSITRTNHPIPHHKFHPWFTGALHKWIGPENKVHSSLSLLSFSCIYNARYDTTGISTTEHSYYHISAHDQKLILQLARKIQQDPTICPDLRIKEIQFIRTPEFSTAQTFEVASPVLIKRKVNDKVAHITYDDPQAGQYLTENLQNKLKAADLDSTGVSLSFDTSYHSPKTKIVSYNSIHNRVNVCPVHIKGTPQQIAFAWHVGIGNSTGIGFGSLK